MLYSFYFSKKSFIQEFSLIQLLKLINDNKFQNINVKVKEKSEISKNYDKLLINQL